MTNTSQPEVVYGPWADADTSVFEHNEPVVVSGFGAVSRYDRLGRGGDGPFIQVRLSALNRPGSSSSNTIVEQLDPERHMWDEIPIGLLPVCHVGQIWHKGVLLEQPEYTYEEFRDIEIRYEEPSQVWRKDFSCVLVWDNATQKGPDGRGGFPLVPVSALRVEPPARTDQKWTNTKRHPGIQCLRVTLPNTFDTLLIPCVEIARFYYANSSRLAHSLFSGFHSSSSDDDKSFPRHLDELYNLAESQILDGVHHIQLRMRFEQEDSATAGRLRYDDNARRRALAIGAHVLREEKGGRPPVVRAEIPFTGRTSLGVHGTWMEHELEGVAFRTFYVFWISKCTGPWPFSQLVCTRDNPHGTAGSLEGGEEGGEEERSRRPSTPPSRRSQGETIFPGTPSLLTGLRKLVLPPPGFEPPPKLVFPEVTASGKRSGWGKPLPEPVTDGVSVQLGSHKPLHLARASVVRGIGETDPEPDVTGDEATAEGETRTRLQLRLETFREAVERLSERMKWELEWRNPDPSASGDPVFPLKDESRKRPAWCYIERGKKNERGKRRHVLIAQLRIGEQFVYLLEAERRANETRSLLVLVARAGEFLGDGLLKKILQQSVDRGSAGREIWGDSIPENAASYKRHAHLRRLEESADAEEQQHYTAGFAAALENYVRDAISTVGRATR